MMQIMNNRREFLTHATGAIIGAAILGTTNDSSAQEKTTEPLSIVDPHLHVWDLKQFRLEWLDHAEPVLKRDFSIADYREAIRGLNIIKSVYVEVSVAPEQREAEARHAIGLCGAKGSPVAGAVIGGVPGTEGFRAYINRFKDNGVVRGVRCSFPRGKVEDQNFLDDLRLLGQMNLNFDLLADASLLSEAAIAVAACPQTRFILDHCGNASPMWFANDASDESKRRADRWRTGIEQIAAQPNVACKISGVAEGGPPAMATADRLAPIVNHCLDRFGPDRVLFASNWPVCLKSITIARWLAAVKEITAARGAELQGRLFSQNALHWYRLT